MRCALTAVSCLVGGFATGVEAQVPGAIELAAVGVWHNKTVPIDGLRGFGLGARLGVWLPAGFGLEGQVDLTRPKNWATQVSFTLVHASASLLYNIPAGESGGSVYLRAGYGKLSPQGGCTIFGGPCASFGAVTGALGFRLPIGGGALYARGEAMVRGRSTYDYTSFGANLGLAYISRTVDRGTAALDDDRDGVANRRDRCQATPLGALVNSRGCPSDTDGDGVLDGIDRCPATEPGTPVDRFGCPARREQPPAS